MLVIDFGMMFGAVEEHGDGPQLVGYLNRRTGEIVLLHPPGDEDWTGVSADEQLRDQARIIASEDWLEIPKIPGAPELKDIDRKEHIHQFLKEHGIEAELR